MLGCDTSGTLTFFYYIKIIANLIFIITPILLIVMGSFDFLGAITGNYSKQDLLNNSLSKIIKRTIIAIIILILPLLINFVMSVVEIGSYDECFRKATKMNIERLEEEEKIKKELEEERKRQEEELKRQQFISNITGGASRSVSNVLNIPYYNQCDSRWGNIIYDTSGASLCSSSCGYTSLAMIVSGLSNDSSVNPYSVIKSLRGIKDGEKTKRGYGAASTTELTNNDYLSKYNISAKSINSSNVVSSLKSGSPVLILVPGHYLTLSISDSGRIVVLDSFTGWASPNKRVGEYNSISQIESAYGQIEWAAAYQSY